MSDLISRQAAIDAIEFGITYAKAINKETGEVKELFQASNDELRKAEDRIKQLPSAEQNLQPTCNQLATDCISRQAAIKALAYDMIRQGVKNPFDYVNEDREDLITLGVIYGIVRMCDAICEQEEQE